MINALKRYVDITRGIVNALGLDDAESGIENVSPELQTVFNPWLNPEHAALRGEFYGAVTSTVAAGGAGNRSIAGLGIAAASGPALLVVELTRVITTSGFRFSLSTTFPTTNNTALISIDGRRRNAPPFVREFEQNNAALPAGISTGTFWTGTTGTYELNKAIMVPAGFCLCVYPASDNEAMTAAFWGRVRLISTRENLG